ncbi:MAG: hypothetical protein AAF657_17680 [Acidobacteriota bacterium]
MSSITTSPLAASSILPARVRPSTLVTVMAWEFWRLARIRLLSALVGIGCLNALFYHLMTMFLGPLPPPVQRNFFAVILFTNIFLIVLILLRSRDADSRNGMELDTRAFLLPLPTWQLVLAKMLFPVVAAGVLWVTISGLTLAVTSRDATGEHWPLLGPALLAAMFTACGLAIFWLPLRPRPLKFVVGFGLLASPIGWFVQRFDAGEATEKAWATLSAADGATFAAFFVAAYGLGVLGTVRARRGITLGFPDVVGALDTWGQRWRRAKASSFRSPVAAQIWLEWRQKGWVLPAIAGGQMVAAAILVGWFAAPETVRLALSLLLGFFFFYIPPLMGCMMGRFNQTSGDASIDVFRASRPMSDTTLAHVILQAGALSLLASWLVAVATYVAALGVVDGIGAGGQLEAVWQMVRGLVERAGWTGVALDSLGLLVISWTNMALVATAFLTGRNAVVAALVFVPYGIGIVAYVVFDLLGTEVLSSLFIGTAWSASGTALALTLIAFVAARRRGLISRRSPAIALALALLVGVAFAWPKAELVRSILESGVALERSLLVLGPGLLALAIAPLALAPLALAWNRHR